MAIKVVANPNSVMICMPVEDAYNIGDELLNALRINGVYLASDVVRGSRMQSVTELKNALDEAGVKRKCTE